MGLPRVLLIHDRWDVHGISTAYLYALGKHYGFKVALQGSTVTTFHEEGYGMASKVRDFNPDYIIVADIPVNKQHEDEFIDALDRIAKASRARLYFVDHHEQTKYYRSAIEQSGWRVYVTSGVVMSYILTELARAIPRRRDIEESYKEPKSYMELAYRVAFERFAEPFIIGNVADLDESIARAFREAEGTPFEIIVERWVKMARVADVRLRTEGMSLLIDMIERGSMAFMEDVDYPPERLAPVLLKGLRWRDGNVIFIDATPPEIHKEVVSTGWLNKTVHVIAARKAPYVAIFKIQKDRGGSEYVATLNLYSAFRLFDCPALDIIEDYLRIKGYKYYGHKGIVGIPLASSPELADLLARKDELMKEAEEIARVFAERANKALAGTASGR